MQPFKKLFRISNILWDSSRPIWNVSRLVEDSLKLRTLGDVETLSDLFETLQMSAGFGWSSLLGKPLKSA